MKNLHQVQLLSKVFHNEKQKYLSELVKINKFIDKKIASINKIIAYQQEYAQGKSLKISKSIPALYNNFILFLMKLQKLIHIEEQEIEKLNKDRQVILEKFANVEQKMKIMLQFEEKIQQQNLYKAEKREQLMLDDLSANKFSRGDYE